MADSTAAKSTQPQPVIMIVDDESMVTKSLTTLIELETDYAVVAFQSPTEALEYLKKSTVDLIISDFLMPEITGLELLEQARKMHPEVPRILLTGYADKKNAIEAINAVGLFQYIEKPWDNENLKIVIRNGLNYKGLESVLKQKVKDLDVLLMERQKLLDTTDMFQTELEMARRVQQSMLPESLPQLDDIRLTARYLPALEIGGDFYDVIALDRGRTAVLIADITGHGIQAALGTALLKFAFTSFRDSDVGATEILRGMNSVLFRGLPSDIFVVALIVELDPGRGACNLVNAGVPHPVLLRKADGSMERVTVNGLLLGMTDDDTYQPGEVEQVSLDRGDYLLLFTDGLTESADKTGEFFETRALLENVEKGLAKPGCEILNDLESAAAEFRQSARPDDDITMICIERR
ncbi:MAG: SpoIIE family protein phosphatase [Candidatus Zixiibacteriota bacterium]|nr:MAG: SpoIIE family protein phosphatase [candidate division Zixibacteria bacterium]